MGEALTSPRDNTVSEIDKDSAEFKAAVAEAIADEVKGLKAKNDELIAKNKKLQAGATISPEDLAAVESERDQFKQQATEATKSAKKAADAADAATKRAEAAEASRTKLIADSALAEALAKAGVTGPAYQKAAKALLGPQVQVIAEGDSHIAKLGDKALSDAITEWAGSDEGKHFVTAPDMSGSGSQGERGKPTETKGDSGGDKAARLARANELLAANSN